MEGITFVSHPVYVDYEASREGIIRHRRLKKNIGRINNMGYMQIGVWFNGKVKIYRSHRFIYECHNGLISSGLVVDQINRNRLDNRIENLRVVTKQQNCFNSAPKVKLQQRIPVIAEIDNDEDQYFSSIYSAGKFYDITPSSIKKVADGATFSAYSKRFHN